MDTARRYLEIALRLGRLAPELVESYTGPPELAARIDREQPSPRALRAEVEELQLAGDGGLERGRQAWIMGQLAGIDAALSSLEGNLLGYRELVERCYGVSPVLVPESRFAAAHERLADALPGNGDVRVRFQRWAETQRVPPELLLPGLLALAEELRGRTRELVQLPEGEQVSFELVGGEHWAANADYLAAFRTHVRVNCDLPMPSAWLLDLVSHEAYPGHHTDHVCKEAALIRGAGRLELCVYVYPTPQALISEGIAVLALEVLLGESADELAAACLRPLGIPYDPEIAAAHREAANALLPVRANIAMLLDEGCSREQSRAYARRWMLEDDRYVDHALEALTGRDWAPYESCYPEGLALCRRFTAGQPTRFKRLLTEQLTTADLLAETVD
jgi:hypothetical protein